MRDAAHEALGASGMGGGEDELAIIAALPGTPVVDIVGRVEADAAVIVPAVVPGEEIDAVRARTASA